jgi:hypothetical protein
VRIFIRQHVAKHSRDRGAPEIEAFLTMSATSRKVSVLTHNQALSALLFSYRETTGMTIPHANFAGYQA